MEAPTDIQKLVDQVERPLAGNGGLRQKGDPSLDQGIRFRPGSRAKKAKVRLLVNLVGRFDAIDRCRLAARGANVELDGVPIRLVWDRPMEGVDRPWWQCPVCGRRCRYVYLRATVACARCHGLQNASRHLRRQTPGVGRVERLRRKLGDCEPKPFAPLPVRIRRGRSRAHHDKLVAMILDEETALLGHLQTVTRDLSRRIRVRKERGQW